MGGGGGCERTPPPPPPPPLVTGLEFNTFHFNQVVESRQNLFTVDDSLFGLEIWRDNHAQRVLEVISEVFGDVDTGSLSFEEGSFEDTIVSD